MKTILDFLIGYGVPEKFARIVVIAIFALIVITLLWAFFAIRSCQSAEGQATQQRIDNNQGAAYHESATDAINTIGGVNANQSASEDLTRRNTEEITHVEGAGNRVAPAVDDAFMRSVCRRAATAHDPKCRLFNAGAAGVAARH